MYYVKHTAQCWHYKTIYRGTAGLAFPVAYLYHEAEIPANLRRNPATASDMALSFSSTHL